LGFNYYMNTGGGVSRVNTAKNGWALQHDTRNAVTEGDLVFAVMSSGNVATVPFTMGAAGLFKFGVLPINAVDDAAAAAAAVPVGGVYRNGSVLMVRAV